MGRTPKITNEEILDAARSVFLDRGVGASTAEIAQKAGISEASIFKRFATKQDLFMAAIGISKMPLWVNRLEKEIPKSEFKPELIEICCEMLVFYEEVMPRVLMQMVPATLFGSKNFVPPPIRDCQLLTDFCDRAIVKGYLRPCNANIIGHILVGAVHNYGVARTMSDKFPAVGEFLKNNPQDSPREFVISLVETVWGGIAPLE
jgi:Bacterial regulatory proteins, tetR family